MFATCVSILLVLAGTAGFAQGKALAVSDNAVVVDGSVGAGEYSWTQDFGQLQLSLNRSSDTLFIGVVGNTKGWVAAGLGSQKMDGATIFMGFVGDDGKVQFKPQAGSGHSHKDLSSKEVDDSIVSFAMKEADGKTTLEIALKANTWIKNGQTALDLIYAMGAQDSFMPRHTLRGGMSVKLVQ
jgi:hypothetical protein